MHCLKLCSNSNRMHMTTIKLAVENLAVRDQSPIIFILVDVLCTAVNLFSTKLLSVSNPPKVFYWYYCIVEIFRGLKFFVD